MKLLRAAIVDDEADSLGVLHATLTRHCPEIGTITSFNDPFTALQAIPSLGIDILFLDIDMPGMNGFELLQKLMPVDFGVIFATAHNEFALKAFKFNAIDYLLKPIDKHELAEAVIRVQEKGVLHHEQLDFAEMHMKGNDLKKIAISSQQGVSFIDLDHIVYGESDSNYTTLVLTDQKRIVISRTLKELQDLLEGSSFMRIHRQYLINLNHVQHLDRSRSTLTMIDKKELPISRQQKDKFLELFKWI